MRAPLIVGFLVFGVLSVVGAVLSVVFLPFLDRSGIESDLAVAAPIPSTPVIPAPQYFPPRPAEAPATIRESVLRGQQTLVARNLPGMAYQRLACSSCHFSGGLTEGGRNNGFSLVGVAARYPADNLTFGLGERIAACYRRNLHMAPPAANDRTTLDTEIYLQWLSVGVPFLSSVPWLQIRPLSDSHSPDAAAGERTWLDVCSACHGEHGEGTRIAPATFGAASFTHQSPMLAPGVLERFIKENMPRGNPNLDDRAVIDVAAFLRKQPRPTATE